MLRGCLFLSGVLFFSVREFFDVVGLGDLYRFLNIFFIFIFIFYSEGVARYV